MELNQMQKGSNILLIIHHLKMASDFMQDFERQYPGTNGARLFKNYNSKIQWMFRDLVSNEAFVNNPAIITGIKDELAADSFTVPAIMEKFYQLPPDDRGTIETIIDHVLKGEVINVEHEAGV